MIRKMFVSGCVLVFATVITLTLVATDRVEEPSLNDLPAISTGYLKHPYRVDPYIAAAVSLQKLGKDRAIEVLRKEAAQPDQHRTQSVIVLCRMLFAAKPEKEFRRAMLGGPWVVGETTCEDWPLEPIELVDGVPFLITYGCTLGGLPEFSDQYLRYCLEECDWSKTEFKPKTEAEKQKAFEKLLASPKWKRPLEDAEVLHLSTQLGPPDLGEKRY